MVNENKRNVLKEMITIHYCALVCDALMEKLHGGGFELQVHSSFHSAVNFSSPIGMITLLAPGKGLQPFSAVLRMPFPFEELPPPGGHLRISPDGISSDEKMLFSFQGTQKRNLSLSHIPQWRKGAAEALLDFLLEHKEKGLVEMAFGEQAGIYSGFLAPRLERLRSAARGGMAEEIIEAAGQMAGCGPGLTPSSDDLLCGYLAGLPVFRQGSLGGQAARAAASKTNDISAALLSRAGEGYVSWDILKLIDCLERDGAQEELQLALKRVADFGSSSGCDFLTGMYLGILDSDESGGMRK